MPRVHKKKFRTMKGVFNRSCFKIMDGSKKSRDIILTLKSFMEKDIY